MTTPYPTVDANPDFVALEQRVLAEWKATSRFQQSVEARPSQIDGKNNEFIFYDGPPFANGLPHYGHLLTGFVKDVFARYQTQRGKRVERRFGWDCHGLPAEMGSEKELGISGRNAIVQYGIAKFNAHCRSSVMKYTGEWEDYVTRQARWVDFRGDYKTMDTPYMESVLWAFKQLYEKGLVYESFRVMPYSWAAETPLSNFETKLDNAYREKTDKAITVAFTLKNRPAKAPEAKSYKILAWTTTPWTLPSNLVLAVSKELSYKMALSSKDGNCYILASSQYNKYIDLLGLPKLAIAGVDDQAVMDSKHAELKEAVTSNLSGEDLVGLNYEPLFPYFSHHPNSFRILDGTDFVTDGEGTGIVHMAPGFGEDDQRVCTANGIEVVVPVDGQGKYTAEIYDIDGLALHGLNVVAETNKLPTEPYSEEQLKKYGLVNLRIIDWLKQHGLLIKQEDYKHNYPHCWRTDTPLIYRAMPSWYVAVTKIKGRMAELNKQINWIPSHVRDGAMGHMIDSAPDWSISRNRFWGTPIPIWRSDKPGSTKLYVFGSIAELQEFFGVEVEDLHRPFIDTLTAADPEDANYTLKRVEDVFDCWFESGSMPFAQVHYPFENKEWFHDHFPADFITEYIAQTRGWFNTLLVLGTALFDKPPFKNCICHGVVIDEETGLKYSKRLKNYKDPREVMDAYGADALRWMMVSSPVMRGMDLAVDPEGKFIRDVVRLYIKPIWNAYNFFTLYANADGVKAKEIAHAEHALDRYILAKLREAVQTARESLDAYDAAGACEAISRFVEVLNNWYIRRNRERFWRSGADADKQAAYDTLYTVLVTLCRAAAPLLPLVTEAIYQGLTGEASVHLSDYPTLQVATEDAALATDMDRVRDACTAILSIRSTENIRVRQPLASVTLYGAGAERLRKFTDLIQDEVNVKEVRFSEHLEEAANFKLQVFFPILGKRLPAKVKEVIPAAKAGLWEKLPNGHLSVAGAELLPEEFSLQLEPKHPKGAQALSSNDALVVLDLEITPELLAEGYARDVVRAVQQARKDADLAITDRIGVTLAATAVMQAMLAPYRGYIAEQVLADQVEFGAVASPSGTLELQGAKIELAIQKKSLAA